METEESITIFGGLSKKKRKNVEESTSEESTEQNQAKKAKNEDGGVTLPKTEAEIQKKLAKNKRRKERKRLQKLQGENPKKEDKPEEKPKKKKKKAAQNQPDKPRTQTEPLTEEAKIAYSQINKAKKGKDVVIFNQLISEFGNKKKLGYALKAFAGIKETKLRPTVISFTSILNACVRCGEIDKAKGFMKEMKERGVKPNEITYTALIKGLTQEGLIKESCEMFDHMKKEGVKPNIRTINTILRGCLRCGDSESAELIFQEMKSLRITPDVSSYEYLLKSRCQSFKLPEAWELLNEMEKNKIIHAPAYVALALSCALVGEIEDAYKALSSVDEALRQSRQTVYGMDNSGTRQSVPLFLKLRNEEVQRDAKRIKEYLKKLQQKKLTNDKETLIESSRVKFLSNENNNEKRLKFKRIFGNKQPNRLEICSGTGDWVTDRADQDKDSNWISLEMRYERVYQIWSRMKFKGLSNMLILAGEAKSILLNNLRDNSLDEVFVNFPDPPVWEESKQQLIDEEFLKQVHRTLKDDCTITILTDNDGYCKTAISVLSKLSNLYKSVYKTSYVNEVPNNYGSSYFDRFWNNGGHSIRFFMKYQKISSIVDNDDEKNDNKMEEE